MIHPRVPILAAALLAALLALPALAEDPPPPPPPPDPPPAPAATSPAPPPAEPFRIARIDKGSVDEANQLLRGRCFGPEYAMRFTLVLEDDDEDDVELEAHGPLSAGRVELWELSFEADSGEVELEFADEEDTDEVDLDEDEPLVVTVMWKKGELTVRADGDDVVDIEPDADDVEAECHVLSWTVREEFYVKDLEIQPIGGR